MCSGSAFPGTNIRDFMVYAAEANLIDKVCDKKCLDRLFTAANLMLDKNMEDNPDNALLRYEFIELLVRVAREKYQKTGGCETTTEAMEKLMQDNFVAVSQHE